VIDDDLNCLMLEYLDIIGVGKDLDELVTLVSLVVDARNVEVLQGHGGQRALIAVYEELVLDFLLT